MYELVFTKYYEKRAKKFFQKNPQLKERYRKILYLLKKDPYYPSLRLHKLKGDKNEFYSVSLDMKYRIILDFVIIDKKIFFIDIGTHDDVY